MGWATLYESYYIEVRNSPVSAGVHIFLERKKKEEKKRKKEKKKKYSMPLQCS